MQERALEDQTTAVENARAATRAEIDSDWNRKHNELKEASRAALQASQSDKQRLQERVSLLEQQLRDASDCGSSSVRLAEEQIRSLRETVAHLESTAAQQAADALTRENAAKEDISRLQDELQAAKQARDIEISKLSESLRQTEAQWKSESKQRESVEQRAATLADKLRKLEAEHAAMLRKLEETGKLAAANDAAKIRALENALQTATADATVARRQQQTTQEQLDEATSGLQGATKRAAEAEAKAASLTADSKKLNEKVEELDRQLTSLMAERSQLLMDLHSRDDSDTAHAAQLKELQSRLSKLTADKVALESELQRARDELQRVAKSNTDAAGFQARIKQLQDEITDLKSAMLNASALSQIHQEKIQQLSGALANKEAEAAEAKRFSDSILSTQAAFDKQRQALEQQRLAAEARWKHLRSIQEETLKTVRKLHNVEKACESGYSCQACLQLLKDPVTCAPCGHVFCRSCFESDRHNRDKKSKGTFCPECDDNSVTTLVANKALDLLTGKFEYRCQVLGDLTALLEKDMMAPENVIKN